MFAALAFVCFLLAVFNVSVGGISLIALGLMFLALALCWGWAPWDGRVGVTRR